MPRSSRQRGAALDPSGRTPAHQLGQVLIASVAYPLLDLGTWALHEVNSVSVYQTYTPGNLVTNSGVTYLCIATNSNQAPPNATYWEVYDPSRRFLDARRFWVPASTVYVPPIDQEILDASSTMAAGGSAILDFSKRTTTPVGADLLDLSTPGAAEIVADGKYDVGVWFESQATNVDAGEAVTVTMLLNQGGGTSEIVLEDVYSPSVGGSGEKLSTTLDQTWYLTAGQIIQVSAINGTARSFTLAAALYLQLVN